MPSTGINHGGITNFEVNDVVVDNTFNCYHRLTQATRANTVKSTSGANVYGVGQTDEVIGGEGFFAEDATFNYKDLYALKGGTTSYLYGSGVVGDEQYSGTGILTQLERTAPNKDGNETFRFEIQITAGTTEAVQGA